MLEEGIYTIRNVADGRVLDVKDHQTTRLPTMEGKGKPCDGWPVIHWWGHHGEENQTFKLKKFATTLTGGPWYTIESVLSPGVFLDKYGKDSEPGPIVLYEFTGSEAQLWRALGPVGEQHLYGLSPACAPDLVLTAGDSQAKVDRPFSAEKAESGPAQSFELWRRAPPITPGFYHITTVNGSYLTVDQSPERTVNADSSVPSPRGTFRVLGRANGNIALQTCDGMYVCVLDNGFLHGNVSHIQSWEEFEVHAVWTNGDVVASKTRLGFLCAENEGGGQVTANRPRAQEWEMFRLHRVDQAGDVPGDVTQTSSAATAVIPDNAAGPKQLQKARTPDRFYINQEELIIDRGARLGTGGFGTVYKGKHRRRDDVAVKVPHSVSVEGDTAKNIFNAELSVWISLPSHKNGGLGEIRLPT